MLLIISEIGTIFRYKKQLKASLANELMRIPLQTFMNFKFPFKFAS
jgi:hypothetical protein